jgi:hypothetical protein
LNRELEFPIDPVPMPAADFVRRNKKAAAEVTRRRLD